MPRVVGIDLAGSPRRPTGYCAVWGEPIRCEAGVVYQDREIIDLITRFSPDVVAIDAPLTLPRGRKSLDRRERAHFRECDLELRRRGIRFFPITLGPMRSLTRRGITLRGLLVERGLNVIEVYPGGAQDVLGLPRKHRDIRGLLAGLRRMGFRCLKRDASGDEADAATCALVGLLYLRNSYEALGDVEEGVIIMPRRESGL
ncbi:MAG: DUF429 domain-containing protein [Aigarchaeota archaeon]|nr:DUF429 domain-containing protein [Candidatus Pelearchaeum maunauluense]